MAKYIKTSQIHPELRKTGELIRFFLPYMSNGFFKVVNVFEWAIPEVKDKDIKVSYVKIPHPYDSKKKMKLHIYQPNVKKSERKKNNACMVWLYGGGYVFGTPKLEAHTIKMYVKEHGMVVVAPEYAHSMDYPYPAALEDAYATLKWVYKNAKKYGINKKNIAVGGESAGGGLAAALAIYARDQKEIPVAFQTLLYPMLDDRLLTKSAQNNDAPVNNTKSNEGAWKLYLGDLYQAEDTPAYAAPGRLTDFKKLPPTFSYVGTIEPFHDEVVAYMESLKAEGIPVHFKEMEGCWHTFDMFAAKSTPAQEAFQFHNEFIDYALEHYCK